jgi:hypothetical protein
VTVTLCLPPRIGEPCLRIDFLIRAESTAMELPSRHRINAVCWDRSHDAIVLSVDIANPATSRPVDVRLDVVPDGRTCRAARTQFIGDVDRNGERLKVYGTYLGVVADEN